MAKKSLDDLLHRRLKVVKVTGDSATALAEYLEQAPVKSVRDLKRGLVLQHARIVILACDEKDHR